METVHFLQGDFKVRYRSEEVLLLPKEFQLLQFLYDRPNRIYTRDELLDTVWSREAPTDRTVDDHIYRLRKKLQPLSTVMRIDTVRGKGYRLILETNTKESPLLEDQEVSSHVKTLFHKYHLYGQGDALKLLEENQQVFGFKLDQLSQLYLRFMQGDFKWMVDTENVSFWNKCHYLIHIYVNISNKHHDALSYLEKSVEHEALPEVHKLEMKVLNRLTLLIFTKQHEKVRSVLKQSKREVHEKNLKGFKSLLELAELYHAFLQHDEPLMTEKVVELENLLEQYPYAREEASFMVAKGLYDLYQGQPNKASALFQTGFAKFKEAKFVPGELMSINIILFFIEEFGVSGELHDTYKAKWQQFSTHYHFDYLENRIKKQLDHHLK